MTNRIRNQEKYRMKLRNTKPYRSENRRVLLAAVLSLAVLVLVLSGCGTQKPVATEADPSDAAKTAADNSKAELFSIPPEQKSHIQIVAAEATPLRRVLRLTGTVAYNNFQTTPVITQIGGHVSRIMVSPGDVVKANQVMLYADSPDYAQMRSGYLKARDALALAEKTYARASDLFAHHANAEADLQAAESARNQAEADLQAAVHGLRVVGITDLGALQKIPDSPEIPVFAPLEGEVVERLVGPGQVLQAGTTQVFTISNLATVWVLANVYEYDLGFVHVGDAVSIQTDAYPDVFRGRISYISPALDPATRTLPVRIETSNPEKKLKKDMYVTATVAAGTLPHALSVPDAAVLRTPENQPFVYVAMGDNQFGQRLVTIGESQDGKTQITDGLREGERIVADGSLFLQFANASQR